MKAKTFKLFKDIATLIFEQDDWESEIILNDEDCTIEILLMDKLYCREDGE